MITIEQALEAIDNLDDYARMDTGVDAVGPRELLVSFVSQSAQLRAENEDLKRRLEFAEAVIAGDRALIAGLRYELAEAKKDAEQCEDLADVVSKALHRAWQLGQTYWQQADAAYYCENKKADETFSKFSDLVNETVQAMKGK